MRWRLRPGLSVAILVPVLLVLTTCGGDDSPSQEDEIKAVIEQFITAAAEDDVGAYCDAVILLTDDDLNSYTEAELDRSLQEQGQYCESDFKKVLRGQSEGPVELLDANVSVSGYRAKAHVTAEVDGKRNPLNLQLAKPTDDGWRVAFTGY